MFETAMASARGLGAILAAALAILVLGAAGDPGETLFRQGHYAEAIAQWRVAARAGDVQARYRLGQTYVDGVVVKRDYAEAARHLKPAAEAGHALAALEYANLLDNGWGVPRSKAKAARFFRIAAERGVPAAMFNLGAMIEAGEGLRSDTIEAFKWYYLSYGRGLDPIVQEPINALAERMKPEEIRAGLDRAQAFREIPWRPAEKAQP